MSQLEQTPVSSAVNTETELKESTQQTNELVLPQEMRGQAIEKFDQEDPANAQDIEREVSVDGYVSISNAQILIENGEYSYAEKLLQEVLAQDAYNELAIRMLGLCFRAKGSLGKAKICYEQAININRSLENLLNLADLLVELSEDGDAYELYVEAAENHGQAKPEQTFEILKNLGNLHLKSGNTEAAEEMYRKAFTLFPDSDVLYVNLGTLEIQKGDFDKAAEYFRQSVTLNSENDKAWVGLALVHREYSDHELALANVLRALDINIYNETAKSLAIDWGSADHKFYETISLLERLLTYQQDDVQGALALAKLRILVRQSKLAQLEISRVLSIDPKNEEAELLSRIFSEGA